MARGAVHTQSCRWIEGGSVSKLIELAGLVALRAMMTDRRIADPKMFAQVRLGIDPRCPPSLISELFSDLLARAGEFAT